VEFAAEMLGTRLVVVMGHTGCKAIDATIDAVDGTLPASRNIASIVDRIRPCVEELVRAGVTEREVLSREAARANVRAACARLAEGSAVIRGQIAGSLRIVGAEYELESGVVDFFHGVPLA
jgi:carbonic anhydrase